MLASKNYKNPLLIASVLTCLSPTLSLASGAGRPVPPPPPPSVAKSAPADHMAELKEVLAKRSKLRSGESGTEVKTEGKSSTSVDEEGKTEGKSSIYVLKKTPLSEGLKPKPSDTSTEVTGYDDERKIVAKIKELASSLDDSKIPGLKEAGNQEVIEREIKLLKHEASKFRQELEDEEKIKKTSIEDYKTKALAKKPVTKGSKEEEILNDYIKLLSAKGKESYKDTDRKTERDASLIFSTREISLIVKKIEESWNKIKETKEKKDSAQNQIIAKNTALERAVAAAKPEEKLVKKIELLLKEALSDEETIKDLTRSFRQYIKEGKESGVLLDSVLASKKELIKYLNSFNKKKERTSDSEDPETSLSFDEAIFSDSKLLEELRKKNAMIEDLQLQLAKLQSLLDKGSSSDLAQAQSIRREQIAKGEDIPVSYSASLVNDEEGNPNIVEVKDDFTGDKILMSKEAAEEILSENGRLNLEHIKGLFDDKYTEQAVTHVIDKPEEFKKIIEDLENKAVDLSEFEVEGAIDDATAATLDNKTKARAFLASFRDSLPEDVARSNSDSIMSFTGPGLVSDFTTVTSSTISQRLDFLSANTAIGVGAGAGDEDDRGVSVHGAWISGVYASGEQKTHNKVFGYKSKTIGGTVGIDFAINDNMLAGLAYSNLGSTIKGKSQGNNHIRAIANLISLYGKIDLNDKVDLGMVLSGNKTEVNHKYRKLTGLNSYTTAKGKFHTTGFNVQSLLSYRMDMDNGIVASPNVGFKYGHQGDGNYTESGTGIHNLSVATKHNNEFIGIVGTKVSKQFLASDVKIVPSLNASIEHHFNAKAHKIKANYIWASKTSEQEFDLGKPAKLAYNLGGNIIAIRNNIEVSADYNCRFKKKYVGHRSTLKVKVLF